MPVLHVYPFALRQGDRWPRINEADMKETLEAAKVIVGKVSQPGSEVVLQFQPIYTLDLAEGSLPAQIQTGYGERRLVKDKLYTNGYLQKMKSYHVVRVFFVWELAPVPDGAGKYAPVKGLTIDSHHLMVLGSRVERQYRPMALAHEFGHGLLGTIVHSSTEGHLMYHEVEKAGASLTSGERDTFSAHAATVAGGTSIIEPP